MTPPGHDFNGLDAKIDIKGFFERILRERDRTDEQREKFEAERVARITDRLDEMDDALELQAKEYARRLYDLNGEYQRDRERQADYVTVDKYEDKLKSEAMARNAALIRVDEKFDEYVKRYEVRQREIDLLLAAQKGAAEAAIKAAEDQGRKANRNLAMASFALGIVVFLANALPLINR